MSPKKVVTPEDDESAESEEPASSQETLQTAGGVFKFENIVQQINRYAWWVTLLAGVGWLIDGIVILALVGLANSALFPYTGYYYSSGAGVFAIIQGVLGIVAGVMGRGQCTPKVAAKQYSAAEKPLLIWGIVGVLAVGGATFLAQYVLIKIGQK